MRRVALGILVAVLAAAPAHAATNWGTYTPLGPEGRVLDVVLTSADELVATIETDQGVVAATQAAGGGATATQPVGVTEWATTQLAADGQGNAFVARVAVEGDKAVQVLERPAGGTFALARSFPGPATAVDVSASPAGHVLVVWSTAEASFAAVRRAGGGEWSAPVQMPAQAGPPQARISSSGWGLVAWPGIYDWTANPLTLVSLSPSGEPSAPMELQASFDGGVDLEIDDLGRFVVGWAEDMEGLSEGPLHLAYGQAGAVTRRLSLGGGFKLEIAANRHGEALLTWMQPTREDTFGTQPNRMATFDLRDGTLGEDVVAPIWTDVSAVTDAGDRIVAGGTHTNYSSRARRGGVLRAVMGFGCEVNPATPRFAGIDSTGQAIAVSQGGGGPQQAVVRPYVVRDRPAEMWGPLYCFTTTPPAQVAKSFKVVAGEPTWVDVKPAVDPEASREHYRWDLDDDGTWDADTGAEPALRHTWAAPGRHALRAQQQRFFGETVETRSWRIEVEVAAAPPLPPVAVPPVKARLRIRGRSLRRAVRTGVSLTALLPKGGRSRIELRRAGRRALLARRTFTFSPGAEKSVRVRLPRSVRRLRSLTLEARAIQRGVRVARARATLR